MKEKEENLQELQKYLEEEIVLLKKINKIMDDQKAILEEEPMRFRNFQNRLSNKNVLLKRLNYLQDKFSKSGELIRDLNLQEKISYKAQLKILGELNDDFKSEIEKYHESEKVLQESMDVYLERTYGKIKNYRTKRNLAVNYRKNIRDQYGAMRRRFFDSKK